MSRIESGKRFAIVLCCAVLILLATACSPSRPSQADGQAALERRNSGIAKLAEFKKTDGQEGNVFGAKIYKMSYEATFECAAASGCIVCGEGGLVYKRDYKRDRGSGGTEDNGYCKGVDNGGKLSTKGKITFTKSEKGWTAQ